MIDEGYLNNLLSNSFYPDKLMKLTGMEKGEDGKVTDFGHFDQLDKCCVITFGLKDETERAENLDGSRVHLSDSKIQKICDILNENNFPAVTLDNAEDVSKILVTSGGIQLPYQKPEDAISMLSDVIDVMEEHPDVLSFGFAHPVTIDSMIPTKIGEGSLKAEIENNTLTESILARNNTTQEKFVNEMLDYAKNNTLSPEERNNIDENNLGKSLYRGATLGNKPYAVLAKRECKNCVYASSSSSTAGRYAIEGERGYTSPSGKKYGFLYEYEVDKNQKYYCDYGIENAQPSSKTEAYETNVYEYKNKLKNIYLVSEDAFTKIADKDGYVSKQWEDFAMLHTPVNRMENEKLVARSNAIYEAAQEEKSLVAYNKRNYDYGSLSVEDVKEQRNDEIYKGEAIHLSGKINNMDIINSLQGPFIIKNAQLENVNLAQSQKQIELQGQFTCDGNTKFSNDLKIRNAEIPQGANLSDVKYLILEGSVKIGDEVQMPSRVDGFDVVLSSSQLKSTTDYKSIEHLTLSGNIMIEPDTSLPNKTILEDVKLNAFDFSNIKGLSLQGHVELAEGVKLPKDCGCLRLEMLKVHDKDIEQIAPLSICVPVVILDEQNNPACSIVCKYDYTGKFKLKQEGYAELKQYSSVETYNKCKAVEEKLSAWGIDKNSYMMITPEDEVYTSYNGTEHRSMQPIFDKCRDDLKNAGTGVVYGSNNGVTAAYFSEDVYIISQNPELRNVLYNKGEDTNIGVVMSNGGEFRTPSNAADENLNSEFSKVEAWKPKEQPVQQAQPQVQQPAQPQVPPQTQQQQVAVKQAPEAVKDMSKKEKGRFFHKLRMGINTLLTKAETQFVRTKEAPQIQKTDINVQAAIKNKGRE